ncbi:methyltransferase domain-containing protein [Micromonospora sp. NPDC049101]
MTSLASALAGRGKSGSTVSIDRAVQQRYSAASQVAEAGLCCPVDYDPQYLKVIPSEVLERDYGCGDPVSYVQPGEHVLDLGSGAGKVCFIAAQIVGSSGSVLGVDLNDDMLGVARGAQAEVARRLGYGNVTFAKAQIEDLALDLEFLDGHLGRHPVRSYDDVRQLEELSDRLRRDSPLVPDGSVDVVISNCVLNLVAPQRKQDMFGEIARVLRPGGRAVISDIVSDIDVPTAMQADPHLWSGCYSGALQEERFLDGFTRVGLTGLTILKREARPWETVGDVEFRSVTVAAYKPPERSVRPSPHAVVYRGPFATVTIDTGLEMVRGRVVPIGPDDLRSILAGPYSEHTFILEAAADSTDDALQHGTATEPPVYAVPVDQASGVRPEAPRTRYRLVSESAACERVNGQCDC